MKKKRLVVTQINKEEKNRIVRDNGVKKKMIARWLLKKALKFLCQITNSMLGQPAK